MTTHNTEIKNAWAWWNQLTTEERINLANDYLCLPSYKLHSEDVLHIWEKETGIQLPAQPASKEGEKELKYAMPPYRLIERELPSNIPFGIERVMKDYGYPSAVLPIADICMLSKDIKEVKQIGEFIITALNCHDDLVKALKDLVSICQHSVDSIAYLDEIEAAKEAILKASK